MWICNIDLNWNCFKNFTCLCQCITMYKNNHHWNHRHTSKCMRLNQLKSNIWESGVIMLYNNAVWALQIWRSAPAQSPFWLLHSCSGRCSRRVSGADQETAAWPSASVEKRGSPAASRNALRRLNLLRDGGARQAKATGGYVHQPARGSTTTETVPTLHSPVLPCTPPLPHWDNWSFHNQKEWSPLESMP